MFALPSADRSSATQSRTRPLDAMTSPPAAPDPLSVPYADCAEGLITGTPAVVRVSGAGPAGRSPAGRLPPSPRPAGAPGSSTPHECRRQRERQSRNGIIDSVVHAQAVLAKESRYLPSEAQQLDEALAPIDFGKIHSRCRDPIFERYPLSLQNHLKRQYIATAGKRCTILSGEPRWAALDAGIPTDSWSRADSELKDIDRRLRTARINLAFDDGALREMAKDRAQFCARIRSQNPPAHALTIETEYARRHGVRPPAPFVRGVTVTACLNRFESPRWWCRGMRHAYSKEAEESLRKLGRVHQHASLYVSQEALALRVANRARNTKFLSETLATNDLRQEYSLIDLAARSTSSPVIRRTELMVRCRGMEEHAREAGYAAIFFVCTLPSRFHVFHKSGSRNSKFDDSTPRAGQQWLCKRWQRARALLSRDRIQYFGIRTTEPNHDGTPHWNVLIFCPPEHIEAIRRAIRKHFLLSESPDEPGAAQHRIHEIRIDSERGSATGYIAKYISKCIDGYRVGADREDTVRHRDTAETVVRVEAWASIHGIRQFQQFGAPPVTVWREIRRLSHSSSGVIGQACQAANEANWAAFMKIMESAASERNGWAIDLFRVWSDKPGEYGDPIGYVVRGVQAREGTAITRDRIWDINWTAKPHAGHDHTLH